MTPEEKRLLLIDLCARLPYRINILTDDNDKGHIVGVDDTENGVFEIHIIEDGDSCTCDESIENFKPYLRPMSSMTEEEAFEMFRTVFHQVSLIGVDIESDSFKFKMVDNGHFAGHTVLLFDQIYSLEQIDWLNKNHFGYRGLIPMGLALEAPEGMYKEK